jgi:hypothetical protein
MWDGRMSCGRRQFIACRGVLEEGNRAGVLTCFDPIHMHPWPSPVVCWQVKTHVHIGNKGCAYNASTESQWIKVNMEGQFVESYCSHMPRSRNVRIPCDASICIQRANTQVTISTSKLHDVHNYISIPNIAAEPKSTTHMRIFWI